MSKSSYFWRAGVSAALLSMGGLAVACDPAEQPGAPPEEPADEEVMPEPADEPADDPLQEPGDQDMP